ncbi:MAG: glycoside hydrolase family 2 TIM barrel-domain containing protein [Balneolaceae bacterium]|nr:glycoside hydrolase family 2 TIM barrel-domain containing protein [Balneolaceae bacterium]
MRAQKLCLLLITFLFTFTSLNLHAQSWQPAGDKIKTTWGENLNPENVWDAYPRPMMEREEWMNLNGLWDYAIRPVNSPAPNSYDGEILVPFAVESSLSGVMQRLGTENELWYEREIEIPSDWNGKDIILHFGAVDWKAEVWLNDIKIGTHTGGYAPFSFDITPYLADGSQTLVVKVWDPTDEEGQPRGKQVNEPGGIYYTPVSGIWQTVWLEPVGEASIQDFRQTPDIDKGIVTFSVDTRNAQPGDLYEVIVRDEGEVVARQKSAVDQSLDIPIPDAKLWSPESPFLYRTEIVLHRDGEEVDRFDSYFAMRKISMERDDEGKFRLHLNNEKYFQFGTLDQGWWPDGLYTAPSDEALKYDIEKTKELGFNMIRKHVKVEPARWYMHADELGMLVWQDMPNGGGQPNWQRTQFFDDGVLTRPPKEEAIYKKEWKEVIDYLYNQPSIVVWVPFNEGWGQFRTKEITEWTKELDPSRLVNSASGGNHFPGVGDILDLHNYPPPEMHLYDGMKANVMGEYGGIGLVMDNHLWDTEKENWGYVSYQSVDEVTDEYVNFAEMLIDFVSGGFTGAIYTQTTDVEGEVNGLMTYDRKRMKVDAERVREINRKVIEALE